MVAMKEEQEKTPLRTIIKQFLNHVDNLDSLHLEDSYEKEFQELKNFSEKLKTIKEYSCSEGENEVNRKKNRYKDILPFDNSRVKLSEYVGVPGSNYINANFIRGASGSPAYIASQGPLPHTVSDFWRMVVEWDVQVIIMACSEEEAAKHKCEHYWVENEGEEKEFGMVSIRLVKASIVCPDFLVRTMLLKYKPASSQGPAAVERSVCQFHYTAWPDHGVPTQVRPLLDMVRKVRETQASETLPVLVHCSAGCGRTGTICAIDYVWGLLRAGKLTENFSLFKLVQDMRRQRIAMVQTKEQYVLIHKAVKELFSEQLRVIDSHPYENIDVNGMPRVKAQEEEEPAYIIIGEEKTNEEKQDGKEKDWQGVNINKQEPPVLPLKRKTHHAPSKQEKEVENLTEKQRTVQEPSPSSQSVVTVSESSSHGSCASSTGILNKPRIAKLKALFERSSVHDTKSPQPKAKRPQVVARSHSLEASTKAVALVEVKNRTTEAAKPIPCRGILRVPQLASVQTSCGGRPALPVKRSKSLKVLGSCERSKLSLVSSPDRSKPLEPKKCGSNLEINWRKINATVDDHIVESGGVIGSDTSSSAKPSVPPKKILGVSVKPTSSCKPWSNCVGDSTQKQSHVAFTGYENYPLSRRRSLESINLEDMAASSSEVPLTGRPRASEERHRRSHHLDEDSRRLLQDCRDYLATSSQSPTIKKNENAFSEYLLRKAQFQNLREDQKRISESVARLGIRERRNSFRQAVSTNREERYETVWVDSRTGPMRVGECRTEEQKNVERSNKNIVHQSHAVRNCVPSSAKSVGPPGRGSEAYRRTEKIQATQKCDRHMIVNGPAGISFTRSNSSSHLGTKTKRETSGYEHLWPNSVLVDSRASGGGMEIPSRVIGVEVKVSEESGAYGCVRRREAHVSSSQVVHKPSQSHTHTTYRFANARLNKVANGPTKSTKNGLQMQQQQSQPPLLAEKLQNPNISEGKSYGLVAGVQLRQGSPAANWMQGRGRGHASVVLLRHSLVEPAVPSRTTRHPHKVCTCSTGAERPEASDASLDFVMEHTKQQRSDGRREAGTQPWPSHSSQHHSSTSQPLRKQQYL